MHSSSVSGGGAPGSTLQQKDNTRRGPDPAASVDSHRPLHERETIAREIAKHSGAGAWPQKTVANSRENMQTGFPGIQVPIPGRPNLQKVFMLHEIVLSA
jgi:hypothetical protein